jgi:MFS family permease
VQTRRARHSLAGLLIAQDRLVTRLSLVTFTVAVGAGLYGALVTLLFTRPGALSVTEFGAGLGAATACGVIAAVPAGRLVDRRGAAAVAVAATLAQGMSMAALPWLDRVATFVPVAILFAMASQCGSTARGSLVARIVPRAGRAEARGYTYVMANLGMALGGLLGAMLAAGDSVIMRQAGLWLDAGLLVVAAGILVRLAPRAQAAAGDRLADRHTELDSAGTADGTLSSPRVPAGASAGSRILVASCAAVLAVNSAIVTVALPIWGVLERGVAGFWIGLWGALGTVIIVSVHVMWSRRAATLPGARRVVAIGAGLLVVAVLVIVLSNGLRGTAAALVLSTAVIAVALGGSAATAASWAMSYLLAPEHGIGRNQGRFNAAFGTGATIAPPVLVFASSGATWGWWALAGAFAVAGALMATVPRSEALEVARGHGVASPRREEVSSVPAQPVRGAHRSTPRPDLSAAASHRRRAEPRRSRAGRRRRRARPPPR